MSLLILGEIGKKFAFNQSSILPNLLPYPPNDPVETLPFICPDSRRHEILFNPIPKIVHDALLSALRVLTTILEVAPSV